MRVMTHVLAVLGIAFVAENVGRLIIYNQGRLDSAQGFGALLFIVLCVLYATGHDCIGM